VAWWRRAIETLFRGQDISSAADIGTKEVVRQAILLSSAVTFVPGCTRYLRKPLPPSLGLHQPDRITVLAQRASSTTHRAADWATHYPEHW
jgi:hypothetical protein